MSTAGAAGVEGEESVRFPSTSVGGGCWVGNRVVKLEHLVEGSVVVSPVFLLGNFVWILLGELLPGLQKVLVLLEGWSVEENKHPLIQNDCSMGDRASIT